MNTEKVVDYIVETYNLSSKLKEKITYVANKIVSDQHIEGFDNIYNYIGRLVEKFRIPYRERIALSLDRKITSDSKSSFYGLFGRDDSDLTRLLEEPPEKISVNEAIGFLEGRLDEFNM